MAGQLMGLGKLNRAKPSLYLACGVEPDFQFIHRELARNFSREVQKRKAVAVAGAQDLIKTCRFRRRPGPGSMPKRFLIPESKPKRLSPFALRDLQRRSQVVPARAEFLVKCPEVTLGALQIEAVTAQADGHLSFAQVQSQPVFSAAIDDESQNRIRGLRSIDSPLRVVGPDVTAVVHSSRLLPI